MNTHTTMPRRIPVKGRPGVFRVGESYVFAPGGVMPRWPLEERRQEPAIQLLLEMDAMRHDRRAINEILDTDPQMEATHPEWGSK